MQVIDSPWKPNNIEHKFPGEMTDLVLADCYLPKSPVTQGYFHKVNAGTSAAGLMISVSNDGEHKSSTKLKFISYDSACMSCNVTTGCSIKVGTLELAHINHSPIFRRAPSSVRYGIEGTMHIQEVSVICVMLVGYKGLCNLNGMN